jgi:hypothetical protein
VFDRLDETLAKERLSEEIRKKELIEEEKKAEEEIARLIHEAEDKNDMAAIKAVHAGSSKTQQRQVRKFQMMAIKVTLMMCQKLYRYSRMRPLSQGKRE